MTLGHFASVPIICGNTNNSLIPLKKRADVSLKEAPAIADSRYEGHQRTSPKVCAKMGGEGWYLQETNWQRFHVDHFPS